ncbi:hypothetical protein [Exiguobacterium sp. s162]|uniref:hypothetical protein n=1 Tax=Exiguobacterium sp. s162 TaxID=2751276 RepID=UPI001BE7903E|nr:hypothetical protein [Exiguobacterium sp. s162]
MNELKLCPLKLPAGSSYEAKINLENGQKKLLQTIMEYYFKNGINICAYYQFSSNDFVFKDSNYVLSTKTKAILAAIEFKLKFNH